MSGHVPKFGGGGGNFTEVFTLARTGAGKTGSGGSGGSGNFGGGSGGLADSAAEDSPRPARGSRAPPRRVTGAGERDVPEPPTRRAPSSEESRGSRNGSRSGSAPRRGSATRNVNEEYAGASHLPKFGDWNNGDAGGDANYTVMFTAASREKQGGSAMGDGLRSKNSSGSSGHHGGRSHRNGKPKPSPSWWCFS